MTGEADPLEYVLARDLGKTLAEVADMSHAEWVRWRAWYVYESAMKDLYR